MTNDNVTLGVVRRFVDSIERGDLASLQSCFATDARIWHNTDQHWATKDENAAGAAYFFEAFTSRKYKVERLEPLSNGAILQFVATITRPDGRSLDWPGCVVFEFAGGEIIRLMEYIDAASFAAAVG
jgi:ketosteroid isomerase-like protein